MTILRPSIAQLVPNLPPKICGVGDYASLLADEFRSQFGLKCGLIGRGGECAEQKGRLNFGIACYESLSQDSVEQCYRALVPEGEGMLIVHYSGYGYARKGAPFWLPKSLKYFQRQLPEVKICTMFHEVHADGLLFTKAYLLKIFQRQVAKRLLNLSNIVQTNCERFVSLLDRLQTHTHRPIRCLPVFSNLGEITNPPPMAARHSQLVAFTSNFSTGQETIIWESIRRAVRPFAISKLILVGKEVSVPLDVGCEVISTGILPANEISTLLAGSKYGMVILSPYYLAKSGIFAAFASHGVVPLVAVNETHLPDGLVSGRHYLPISEGEKFQRYPGILDEVSLEILHWYKPHCLSNTCSIYAEALSL